jgi:tetratricopeptide (TPR) repeat protein
MTCRNSKSLKVNTVWPQSRRETKSLPCSSHPTAWINDSESDLRPNLHGMAKTKPPPKSSGAKKKRGVHGDHEILPRADGSTGTKKKPESPEQLHFKASELLLQLQVDKALPIAQKARDRFEEVHPNDALASYPALLLLGEIYLARGEVDSSREHYLKATELDPEGRKIGAAPFLWSAQLSEDGGEDSIRWFEKACTVLRRELKDLEERHGIEEAEDEIIKTRGQLGEALCSMTEVYMTDLSYATPDALFWIRC